MIDVWLALAIAAVVAVFVLWQRVRRGRSADVGHVSEGWLAAHRRGGDARSRSDD